MEKKPDLDTTKGLMSVHMEGFEIIEKEVKQSGNSGRVYLPHSWVGSRVKIVRITPISKEAMGED